MSDSAARPEFIKQLSTGDTVFVCQERVGAKIKEMDGGEFRYQILGPAADSSVFRRTDLSGEELDHFGSDVAIILDAVSLSPDEMGVQWDTHKKLVSSVIGLIKKSPQRLNVRAAEELLDTACRQIGFALDVGEVRRDLTNLMCRHLAPTLTVLRLIPLLTNRFSVKLWGRNWEIHDETTALPCDPSPTRLERSKIYNASKIVLHLRNDEADEQQLVDALGAGACVLRQKNADPQAEKNRSLFDVWQLVPAFADVRRCLTMIGSFLNDEDQRRSALSPAHTLVREKHLMRHRLATLLGS